jgi:hypothetical protein
MAALPFPKPFFKRSAGMDAGYADDLMAWE